MACKITRCRGGVIQEVRVDCHDYNGGKTCIYCGHVPAQLDESKWQADGTRIPRSGDMYYCQSLETWCEYDDGANRAYPCAIPKINSRVTGRGRKGILVYVWPLSAHYRFVVVHPETATVQMYETIQMLGEES